MSFRDEILALSGQNVNLCFQCNKCSSGCPMGDKVEMGLSARAKSAVESAAQMVARWYHILKKRSEDRP
jgi:heterodisulfide reductase subunit C